MISNVPCPVRRGGGRPAGGIQVGVKGGWGEGRGSRNGRDRSSSRGPASVPELGLCRDVRMGQGRVRNGG